MQVHESYIIYPTPCDPRGVTAVSLLVCDTGAAARQIVPTPLIAGDP